MLGLRTSKAVCVIGRSAIVALRLYKDNGLWTPADIWKGSVLDGSELSGMKDAIKTAVDGAGITGSVSLSFSDAFARTALLDFRELPDKSKDKDILVKWRTSKELYLKPDDWRIEYFEMPKSDERRVVSVAVRVDAVAACEELFEGMGIEIEKIGVNSINLFNLVATEIPGATNAAVYSFCNDTVTSMIFKNGIIDHYAGKSCANGNEFLDALASTHVMYLDKNPQLNFEKIFVFCDDAALYDGIREITKADTIIVTPGAHFKSTGIGLEAGVGVQVLSAIGLIG